MITVKPFQAIAFGTTGPVGDFEKTKQRIFRALSIARYSVSTDQLNVADVYLGERAQGMNPKVGPKVIMAYFRPRNESSSNQEFEAFVNIIRQIDGANDFIKAGKDSLQGRIHTVPIQLGMYKYS